MKNTYYVTAEIDCIAFYVPLSEYPHEPKTPGRKQ
jgi:hypothetical protein